MINKLVKRAGLLGNAMGVAKKMTGMQGMAVGAGAVGVGIAGNQVRKNMNAGNHKRDAIQATKDMHMAPNPVAQGVLRKKRVESIKKYYQNGGK